MPGRCHCRRRGDFTILHRTSALGAITATGCRWIEDWQALQVTAFASTLKRSVRPRVLAHEPQMYPGRGAYRGSNHAPRRNNFTPNTDGRMHSRTLPWAKCPLKCLPFLLIYRFDARAVNMLRVVNFRVAFSSERVRRGCSGDQTVPWIRSS